MRIILDVCMIVFFLLLEFIQKTEGWYIDDDL